MKWCPRAVLQSSVPMRILFVMLALALAPGAFADDAADLKVSFEAAVTALNRGDIDGFLADIHPEAMSFYSCGPTSGKQGKEACQLDWERFFGKTKEARFEPQNMHFKVVGNTGMAWGDYDVHVVYQGKKVSHKGRYVFTYTKAGGKWMVVMQHNTPASMAPQPVRKRKPSSE